jgi:hypothetical protein
MPEGYEDFEAQRKEARVLEFRATSPSKGSATSPTGSEDEIYQMFLGIPGVESELEKEMKPEMKRMSTPGPRAFFKSESSPISKPKKAVNKAKLERGSFVTSLSAKMLKEAGVLDESTLALMGMMDQMSEVLNKLADRGVPAVVSTRVRAVSVQAMNTSNPLLMLTNPRLGPCPAKKNGTQSVEVKGGVPVSSRVGVRQLLFSTALLEPCTKVLEILTLQWILYTATGPRVTSSRRAPPKKYREAISGMR